jgi:hydrogenase-4 membrane subunit HyfE
MVLSFSKNHILLHILVIYLKTLNLNFLFFSKKKNKKKRRRRKRIIAKLLLLFTWRPRILKIPYHKGFRVP